MLAVRASHDTPFPRVVIFRMMHRMTTLLRTPDQNRPRISLVGAVDLCRLAVSHHDPIERRSAMGQFPTPPPIARFMASLFSEHGGAISLLDAGAGVGSLTAAFVAEMCGRSTKPKAIHATGSELDKNLADHLFKTGDLCASECETHGVQFTQTVIARDFIKSSIDVLNGSLFLPPTQFNCAILNPPYKKIKADSEYRRLLRSHGIESNNLYTAFLTLAILMLKPGGELVAITPRSFCNGPYFKPFRSFFLDQMALRRIHIFDSREAAFAQDGVLQENIIFHAVKCSDRSDPVTVSSSFGPADPAITQRQVAFGDLVKPDDKHRFIHIVPDESSNRVSRYAEGLRNNLSDLGLAVSTGRVVDFRARHLLRQDPGEDTVPLIYPGHFVRGHISWPKAGARKPNAIVSSHESNDLLIDSAVHVLVKRFSAKEEKRRIVAAVFNP